MSMNEKIFYMISELGEVLILYPTLHVRIVLHVRMGVKRLKSRPKYLTHGKVQGEPNGRIMREKGWNKNSCNRSVTAHD